MLIYFIRNKFINEIDNLIEQAYILKDYKSI